jgi:hypothetical protein
LGVKRKVKKTYLAMKKVNAQIIDEAVKNSLSRDPPFENLQEVHSYLKTLLNRDKTKMLSEQDRDRLKTNEHYLLELSLAHRLIRIQPGDYEPIYYVEIKNNGNASIIVGTEEELKHCLKYTSFVLRKEKKEKETCQNEAKLPDYVQNLYI